MKKTFFASDFHLGVDARLSSSERQLQIVRWLDSIKEEAEAIYIVGDLFDFWYEYKEVVPKGYTRLFGKLQELRDMNITIYFFTGNHDMWMFRYFEDEFGIKTYREPQLVEIHGKRFLIGHGDGLGPGDHGYKFIKKVFSNRFFQWMFRQIHPDLGIRIANFWSGASRGADTGPPPFLGEEQEWLAIYSNEYIERDPVDFLIFGHRHIPMDITLKNGHSRYINLGEWLYSNSYAEFDGTNLTLKAFENDNLQVFS